MEYKKRYEGLDFFRLIASFMVIGIHTFPFSSFNPNLDKIITLSLFRLAVPFFFMVTGYFLLGPYRRSKTYLNENKIDNNIRKILKLYLLSVLIYLPLSYLNGSINTSIGFLELVKLLVFDGSFYHLWYFPALILGIYLTKALIKTGKDWLIFLVSFLLYLVGLFGDSYYGILDLSFLKSFYEGLFSLFSYTRNGIFMAPIFLAMGALSYGENPEKSKSRNYLIFILGLGGLLAEGYFVNILNEPRHNSMYFSLIPAIYGLFNILLASDLKIKLKNISKITSYIYILHPLVIYGLYLMGKFAFKIDNSLINYMLVSLISFGLAYFLAKLKLPSPKKSKDKSLNRINKYISKDNLLHNLGEIKKHSGQSQIMAVIKTNGYGHNDYICAKILEEEGLNYLAVATLDEALKLRKKGIKSNILVFGYVPYQRAREAYYYDIILTVIDYRHGLELNSQGLDLRCHLKIDTGMHRLGIDYKDLDKILELYRLKNLKIEGIYSHLASSDSLDDESRKRSLEQIENYDSVLKFLRQENIETGLTHIQSSYGIVNYNYLNYDLVRTGIFLYGCKTSKDDKCKIELDLRPVMTVKAKLVQIKNINCGEYVGYGLSYRAKAPKKIAIVSMGYGDGLPRNISNKKVKFYYKGQALELIGRVCMDMFMVDISNIKDIEVYDEITIIDQAEDLAKLSNTISNEILCRLSNRLSDLED